MKVQCMSDAFKLNTILSIDTKGTENYVLDGTKLPWHYERVKAWLEGERIAPVTIDMALTRGCNYKCEYCYSQLQSNPVKPITKDVAFRFLDDAVEIGVKAISLVSDGESTISPIYKNFILRGSQNGISMALGTNGYFLTEEDLYMILPHLTYLRFNISAANAQSYSQIHGVPKEYFERVCEHIATAVYIKRSLQLKVTLGMQMVLMPHYGNQILPLVTLAKTLGVDYLVIKHCSDDEYGSLGVDYSQYKNLEQILKEAEKLSSNDFLVKVKWSKIQSEGKRSYKRCYGPPFIIQLSGSGLVAPCGMFFGERYKEYWIGNIVDTTFKKIWQSKRYWDVINHLASEKFDAQKMCGCLCLQHKVNEYLDNLKKGLITLEEPQGPKPEHINFV